MMRKTLTIPGGICQSLQAAFAVRNPGRHRICIACTRSMPFLLPRLCFT
jgi:hypothetical protein